MFNRYKIFLLAVITLLLLTGLGSCNQQGYNPPHTQNQKPEVPGDSVRLVVTPYEYKEGKFDITYPQFEGMADRSAQDKMNDLIRQRVDTFIQSMTDSFEKGKEHRLFEHYTAKMQYKMSLLNDELLSLTISTYTYTGGAHGASTVEGYTFKLATGERMLYRDLFPFDNESRQALNEKIEQQIRDRNIIIFKPYQGVSDNPNYYLKEGNRLVIIFGQYEIAPYAAGILQFEIPQNTRGSTTY